MKVGDLVCYRRNRKQKQKRILGIITEIVDKHTIKVLVFNNKDWYVPSTAVWDKNHWEDTL